MDFDEKIPQVMYLRNYFCRKIHKKFFANFEIRKKNYPRRYYLGPKLAGNSARNGFAADQQNQQEITKILVVEKKLSQRPKQEFLSQFDQKKKKKKFTKSTIGL